MENINDVKKGIQDLINDTIQTENEGSRRCINSDDLNVFEDWLKILNGETVKLRETCDAYGCDAAPVKDDLCQFHYNFLHAQQVE